jgi:hypothetical protein
MITCKATTPRDTNQGECSKLAALEPNRLLFISQCVTFPFVILFLHVYTYFCIFVKLIHIFSYFLRTCDGQAVPGWLPDVGLIGGWCTEDGDFLASPGVGGQYVGDAVRKKHLRSVRSGQYPRAVWGLAGRPVALVWRTTMPLE